jgi:hypothetical protein
MQPQRNRSIGPSDRTFRIRYDYFVCNSCQGKTPEVANPFADEPLDRERVSIIVEATFANEMFSIFSEATSRNV